ncbi:MAG TPA: TlpA disulfide reductase family protein [Kofleriaceae bacterium]|nr:TlpA disulfide reductase family protein [Kofleriaceae bacterium]
MNNSTKALVALLLAGLTGATIFIFVSLSGGGTASAKTCQVGERDCLPDVNYVDTVGTAYTPKTLKGKVVVVNFWATWCKPCLKEIPDLSAAHDRYKDRGLVVLGMLTDTPDNQTLLNFQSDNMMSYPVVRVGSDILAAFDYPAEKIPITLIYDRRGKRAHSHLGTLSSEQLAKYIEPLLAQH